MPEKRKDSKKLTIKVGSEVFPCYPTMGAAVRFKDLTGRDIDDMKGTSDFAKYIYCCAKSASRREKKDFDMSLEDFCDNILIEDLNDLNKEMAAANDTDGTDGDAKKN